MCNRKLNSIEIVFMEKMYYCHYTTFSGYTTEIYASCKHLFIKGILDHGYPSQESLEKIIAISENTPYAKFYSYFV